MVFGDRRRRLCSPPSLSRSLPRRRRRRSPSPAARRFPAAARAAAAAAADDQPEVDRAREGGRKEVPLLPHPPPSPIGPRSGTRADHTRNILRDLRIFGNWHLQLQHNFLSKCGSCLHLSYKRSVVPKTQKIMKCLDSPERRKAATRRRTEKKKKKRSRKK